MADPDLTPTPEDQLRWSRAKENAYWPQARHRLLWWGGLLLLAMVASYPDPRAIGAFYLFPLGLVKALLPQGEPYEPYLMPATLPAYLFYLVHFVLFLALSAKKYFYILLWILIFALTLNMAGCHMILIGVQNIH